MERNYKVYVHINKANGKRYYGITCQKVERRWGKNGNGYRFCIDKKGRRQGNEYFWNSICKYGWNNFEHIVLFNNLTKEEAEKLEIDLIKKYNTTNKKYGYNYCEGGKTNRHNEEARKRISKAMKGRISPNKGKKASEETKRKQSNVRKGKYKGKDNTFAKSVYIIELNKEFETLSDCAKFLDCSISNISFALNNKTKTCKGYHIIYTECKNDINKINKIINSRNLTTNQVYIVELNKEFNSIKECAEFLGCNTGSITNVLIGKRKSLYGYHIIYTKDRYNTEKINKITNNKYKKEKEIYIVELDKTFNSLKECAKFFDCFPQNISRVVRGERETYKGYHIIYAKDKELED